MAMLQKDEHVSVHPMFTIPEGKMEEFFRPRSRNFIQTRNKARRRRSFTVSEFVETRFCVVSILSPLMAYCSISPTYKSFWGRHWGYVEKEISSWRLWGRAHQMRSLNPRSNLWEPSFDDLQDGAFLMNTTFKNKPPRTGACWPLCGGQKVDDV